MIARGESNAEIIQHRIQSPNTVRNHISNIISNLQAADLAEAIIGPERLPKVNDMIFWCEMATWLEEDFIKTLRFRVMPECIGLDENIPSETKPT